MNDIKKSPQYELYLTTLKLNANRDQLKPKRCSNYRGIYGTIISRAYYSAYSYASLWLYKKHNFKPIPTYILRDMGEEVRSEHKQVIEELSKYDSDCADKLIETKRLRTTADYHMSRPLSKKKCDAAIENMKIIFKNLKF